MFASWAFFVVDAKQAEMGVLIARRAECADLAYDERLAVYWATAVSNQRRIGVIERVLSRFRNVSKAVASCAIFFGFF